MIKVVAWQEHVGLFSYAELSRVAFEEIIGVDHAHLYVVGVEHELNCSY